jgi:hypothetical protein
MSHGLVSRFLIAWKDSVSSLLTESVKSDGSIGRGISLKYLVADSLEDHGLLLEVLPTAVSRLYSFFLGLLFLRKR